ncbi:MAG: ABC transporter ATP-binding protein, partial [Bdellovibrionales bacterium]|nr:ABC transporter ATP-binding protein [Bdellovibrionales bacterium]
MSIAISVKNLVKRFQIYDSPRDRMREAFRIFRKTPYFSEVTALKDVTFEIQKGRFVGIVGSNGAGKSTLLKMLSGELTPTSGSIEMSGKVALLQLGVGFNAQLTGRENAMFAANLLGYSDKDLSRVILEVEAFAEIGAFFDHPVRTYSSGMYSRLAFAVAVNVDPDILIADEVLAVGDMSFSQRCLRKMREFKDRGKTVLLVSHDLPTINAFCDEVLWIKDSTIFMQGETARVTEHFKNFMYYGKLPPKNNESLAQKNKETISGPTGQSHWLAIGQRNDVIGEGGIHGIRSALTINGGPGTQNAVPGDKVELSIEFAVDADI